MRIFSQDGTIDMPYELLALSVSCKIVGAKRDASIFCVNAHSGALNAKRIIMGEYSSEEKAKKALDMLRDEYQYTRRFETICNGTTDYPSQPNYCFQFPTDDEVEV